MSTVQGNEWYVQEAQVVRFIEAAVDLRARFWADVSSLLAALEVPFQALLAAPGWLPDEFGAACESGGMGGGIGQWLLYRDRARSLVLFSLVVPPGSATPVHDHHAWGLVGLYRGEQEETLYPRLTANPGSTGLAPLAPPLRRSVKPGDTYRLIPPDGDVHAVTTTSGGPSVSIHLLGADAGCVWRHRFEPHHNTASAFRSGYTNVPCVEEPQPDLAAIRCAV